MSHTQPNTSAEDDAEVTITKPRFDADATKVAQPVVPLAQVPEHGAATAVLPYEQQATLRRPMGRGWSRTTVIASIIAAAAMGGIAVTIYQRSSITDASMSEPAPRVVLDRTSNRSAPEPSPTPAAHGTESVKTTEVSKRPAVASTGRANYRRTAAPRALSKEREAEDEDDVRAASENEDDIGAHEKGKKRRPKSDDEELDENIRKVEPARREVDRIREVFEAAEPQSTVTP